MTPKQARRRRERTDDTNTLAPEMSTLDPDFDDSTDVDAEFAAWRWPERVNESA
jgi:hypothetical protein